MSEQNKPVIDGNTLIPLAFPLGVVQVIGKHLAQGVYGEVFPVIQMLEGQVNQHIARLTQPAPAPKDAPDLNPVSEGTAG